ncbi:MAG: hypothetical protein QOE01_589 [Actinomycetota bacterium]|jgi:polyisoprenoid-binding protein YceI|nr:hypothetical protein [Actinomycetota bacterium]
MNATIERRTARSGRWVIDPDRAFVGFSGRSSFITPTISARFSAVTGSIRVGANLSVEDVAVEVDVTSMTSGNRAWDDLLGSLDPFDAGRHPIATYRSTYVRRGEGQADIEGVLTLRGVSRSLALTASYEVNRHADRLLVRASGTVNREEFGVRCDLPGVGKLVPGRLRLDIDVDALLAA